MTEKSPRIEALEATHNCYWSDPTIRLHYASDGKYDGYVNGVVYKDSVEIKDGELVIDSFFEMIGAHVKNDPDHRFIETIEMTPDYLQVEVFLGS